MFRLSRLRFPAGTIIPAHSHTGFQLCLLVRGQLKMWSSVSGHSRSKVLNTGSCWIAGPHTEHSVLITEDSQLVRLELGLSLLKHRPELRAVRRSLVIAALLTIQASRACSSQRRKPPLRIVTTGLPSSSVISNRVCSSPYQTVSSIAWRVPPQAEIRKRRLSSGSPSCKG